MTKDKTCRLFLLIISLFSTFLWSNVRTEGIQKFSKTLMGADVHILVDSEDSPDLKSAITATYTEGERLNTIFSDYHAESEISRFFKTSGTGKSMRLSKELFDVLEHAKILSDLSNGAFDVTVGPLSRLWRIARFQKKLPNSIKLSDALKRTGHQHLVLNNSMSSGELLLSSMVLDLGGIAKGYVADRMLEMMKSRGYPRCLIDAGGDLTIGDAPRNRDGWRVEIGGRKHPELPIMALSNCAVATSGDLEQFLEIGDKRYSHIINPHTGYGLTERAQSTVIAPNCMLADSLASTSLGLGFERSCVLLKDFEIECFYFLHEKESNRQLNVYKGSQ